MLDVIADFWKPAKKAGGQVKLEADTLQVGSSIGFGFVSQSLLSGHRFSVSAINTYQFGDENLTSFLLVREDDKEVSVSMILADSGEEQYLAISRRMTTSEREKLFDKTDLENILNKAEISRLPCADNVASFKSWVVASYKREIQGMKGRFYKEADSRQNPTLSGAKGEEFSYILLVSDNNEHAIEIEKYNDGHLEIYATIYRRMGDIGEIMQPSSKTVAAPRRDRDLKMVSKADEVSPPAASATAEPPKETKPTPVVSTPAQVTASSNSEKDVKSSPIKLREFSAADVEKPIPAIKPAPTVKSAPAPVIKSTPKEEPMTSQATTANGTKNPNESVKPSLYVQPAPEQFTKQEIKTVTKPISSLDVDSIECDLRVANKIIDEAIRNEMRLTDVVRRIIELPVANPESVQIPVTLTDEDYALLAIRYGISSSDRNGIKRRILEDLNDFSGAGKQAVAA